MIITTVIGDVYTSIEHVEIVERSIHLYTNIGPKSIRVAIWEVSQIIIESGEDSPKEIDKIVNSQLGSKVTFKTQV